MVGRRIVELQTSQALINSPQEHQWPRDADGVPLNDEFGRKPYLHPALNGLEGLTDEAESLVLSKSRLAPIAERYRLDKVTRWTPKRVSLNVWCPIFCRLTFYRRITSKNPGLRPFS